MKICILSMQRVKNYGSLLQAYSLKKLIESLGHEVSFIDIEPNESENQIRKNVVKFDEGQQAGSQNILLRILAQDNNPYYAIKKAISKKQIQKKQGKFQQDILKLALDNNNSKYDVCVIGSDEVFNCMNDATWGFTTQLFGNVAQASKVITYAASCGFTRCEMLSGEVKKAVCAAFQNVSAFSVRDDNTVHFVEELSKKKPQVNLDPVAVGDFYTEIQSVDIRNRLPQKYCIIYAYHDRINSPEEICAITEFCNQNHLTPVTIGGYQKWVHKHLALSPFEVLAAFKDADFVVTDTFHGTLFSIKYAKRFAVIVRESNRNKLLDLVKRFGVERHELKSMEDIERVYHYIPDRAGIDAVIEKERECSLKYLEENL